MKNKENWVSSKIESKHDGSWRIRIDGISPGSFLTAEIQQKSLIPLIHKYLHGRVADIGAGNAPYYPVYRDHADEIICIDWGESPHDSQKHSDLLCDLNKGLPLPDASIEAALLSSVLEHLAEPLNLLKDIHRCLTPGGYVVMEVPFLYWLHEEPHDYHRYTRYALARMAKDAGFDIVEITPYGNAFIVMCDIAAKITVMISTNITCHFHWRVQRALDWLNFGAIRFFQRVVLLTITRGPVAQMLIDSKFQHKFPLGYVVVLNRPSE